MLASGMVAVGAPTVFETAMVLTIKMKRDGQPLLFVGGDFAGTDALAA